MHINYTPYCNSHVYSIVTVIYTPLWQRCILNCDSHVYTLVTVMYTQYNSIVYPIVTAMYTPLWQSFQLGSRAVIGISKHKVL